jgi:RHS repeat-associated protein
MKRLSMASILALLFCHLANAQAPTPGLPSFGTFSSDGFDAVNLQNLNVYLAFPIASSPGRGPGLQLVVPYNSAMWVPSGGVSKTWQLSGGWNALLSSLGVNPIGQISYLHFTDSCTTGNIQYWNNYTYADPSGTLHSFPTIEKELSTCGPSLSNLKGYAGDGSGYYMDATNYTEPTVYSPSGTKVVNGTGTYPWSLTDANGNFIIGPLGSGTEHDWIDTLGQTAFKVIVGTTSTTFEYLDTNGNFQSVVFNLTASSVKTSFACSGVGEFTGTVNLPTSVVYPNGQTFSFKYESTPGSTSTVTGRLSEVTLPTGGTISYAYTGANDGVSCTDGSILGLTRTTIDGTTTYSNVENTPASLENTTTVTAPKMPYDTSTNQSVFVFEEVPGYTTVQLSAQYYKGTATGTPFRTITTTVDANILPATKTIILEDGKTQSEIETAYDPSGNGNLNVLKEHDWGSSAPGSILRTTNFTYLTGTSYSAINLINRVTKKTVADSTGTIHSEVDTAYDGNGAFSGANCITGLAQHDDTDYPCSDTARGDATSVTSYTNAAAKTGAITKLFTYDSLGNLRSAQLDCCQQEQWNYSATTKYAYPDSLVRGLSTGTQLTTGFKYFLSIGQLQSTTDSNNQVTSYLYDAMRRMTSVTRPDNAQIAYDYVDAQNYVAVTTPLQGTSTMRHLAIYDGLGRTGITETQDSSLNEYSSVSTQYDPLGRPYMTSNPYTTSPSYWTTTQFDAIGRPTKVIAPDNSTTTYLYSTNSTTVTDPAGKARKSVSDGLGRLTSLYEPDVTNGNSLTLLTSYTYSVLNGLATVTQGAQTRTYVHDDIGRLTSATTPEAATVSFQYNNFDLATQRTDARGVVTNVYYDTLNRLAGLSYTIPQGSTVSAMPNVCTTQATQQQANVCYYYDQGGTSANALGRLTEMIDPTGSETSTYDILGRTTQVKKVINGTTYPILYGYNLASELTSMTYPSGRVVQPTVDAIGRLSTVADTMSGTNTTYASRFTYNPAFQITGLVYGSGVSGAFTYSLDRLQLTGMSYTDGSANLFGSNYFYKTDSTNCPTGTAANNGQIQCIIDTVDHGRSATYSYDGLARLTAAGTAGSTAYPKWGLSWTYDRYGNRTAQSVTAGTAPSNSVVVNAANNQITTVGYSYDASGNLTGDGVNAIVYDAKNRETSSSGSLGSGTYAYDGNGLRVQKISGSTTTVYLFSGSKVIGEYQNGAAPTSPTREYMYAGNTMLAKIQSGTTTYYHQDHHSNRMVTNGAGTVTENLGTYPFGDSWYNQTSEKWLFATYERDSESSNDYAMARYSVNRLGRLSSTDPISGTVADPQSLNHYAYTENDPVNLGDPSGTMAFPWEFLISFYNPAYANGGNGGCQADGLDTPCGMVMSMLNGNGVTQCPNNDCAIGTATPFQCADSVCGYMSNQYVASHENVWNGILYSDSEWAQFIRNAVDAQHRALSDAILNAIMQADPNSDTTWQNVYDDLSPDTMKGGNVDFKWTGDPDLLDFIPDSQKGGCEFLCRVGSIPSIHMDNGDIHLDAGNPLWGFGLGFLVHFSVDMVLGNINPSVPIAP